MVVLAFRATPVPFRAAQARTLVAVAAQGASDDDAGPTWSMRKKKGRVAAALFASLLGGAQARPAAFFTSAA
jgi:hypothetical protein